MQNALLIKEHGWLPAYDATLDFLGGSGRKTQRFTENKEFSCFLPRNSPAETP